MIDETMHNIIALISVLRNILIIQTTSSPVDEWNCTFNDDKEFFGNFYQNTPTTTNIAGSGDQCDANESHFQISTSNIAYEAILQLSIHHKGCSNITIKNTNLQQTKKDICHGTTQISATNGYWNNSEGIGMYISSYVYFDKPF